MRKVTLGTILFVALIAAGPASAQGTIRGAKRARTQVAVRPGRSVRS